MRLSRLVSNSIVVLFAGATGLAANAQTWRIVPTIGFESTLTDNVDLAPSGQQRSDWVNQITPGVRFTETGAHTKLSGTLTLPMLVYARTSTNNYIAPEASITGTFEAFDRHFFVDASANVSQQFLSPFGPRSSSLANATQNRYTSQVYTVSPHIQGTFENGINYMLRQQSIWSDAAGIPGGTESNRIYTNNIDGSITREPIPVGWSLEYSSSDNSFADTPTAGNNYTTTKIGRLRALYQPDPGLRLSASGGYEDNRFFFTNERGATYGAGIVWHPTDRTNLNATYEHRFFGASYHVAFDHRMPLTVWSISASRDITSYPQQLAGIPAGVDVNSLLNSLFSSRVPDPSQRQSIVDQLIRDRGLPGQLSAPIALYAQQVTLTETANATFGVLGARNTILFTAYHSRNEPAERTEETLTPLLDLLSNTTQNGLNVTWTHQLAPGLTFAAYGDASRATSNTGNGAKTNFYTVTTTLSRSLSALTSAYIGTRYQRSISEGDFAASYREFAVLIGLTHTFH